MFCTAVIKYKYEYKKVLNKKYVISSNCDCVIAVIVDYVLSSVEYLYLYFVLLYLAFH